MSSACFAGGLAFAEFAFLERAGVVDVAMLNDTGDEYDAVDATIPAVVESMPYGPAIALAPDESATAPVPHGGVCGVAGRVGHHIVGDLALAYESLDLRAEPGLTMTIYAAEPDSPTAHP